MDRPCGCERKAKPAGRRNRPDRQYGGQSPVRLPHTGMHPLRRILAGKETHDCSYALLAPQPEQPHRVTTCNPLRLISRELGQPSTILLEYRIVTEPALVDPGIRTKEKPVRIPCK